MGPDAAHMVVQIRFVHVLSMRTKSVFGHAYPNPGSKFFFPPWVSEGKPPPKGAAVSDASRIIGRHDPGRSRLPNSVPAIETDDISAAIKSLLSDLKVVEQK